MTDHKEHTARIAKNTLMLYIRMFFMMGVRRFLFYHFTHYCSLSRSDLREDNGINDYFDCELVIPYEQCECYWMYNNNDVDLDSFENILLEV